MQFTIVKSDHINTFKVSVTLYTWVNIAAVSDTVSPFINYNSISQSEKSTAPSVITNSTL